MERRNEHRGFKRSLGNSVETRNEVLMRIKTAVLPVVAAFLFSQGCVGGVTQLRRVRTFAPPDIRDGPGTHSLVAGVTNPAAAWLRDHWGQPASIRPLSEGSQEEAWTYKCGCAWYGVIPFVVVPVPLILPLESKKVVFLVREGQVISAEVVDSNTSGWVFGPFCD